MEYSCTKCDFKIIEEDEMFHINSEKDEIEEYLLVMSTASFAEDAIIEGYIHRTYCPHCDKLIKRYTISETKYTEEETITILEEKIEKTPVDNSLYFSFKDDDIYWKSFEKQKFKEYPILSILEGLVNHVKYQLKKENEKQNLRNHFMEKFTNEDKILYYIEYNESFINMIPVEREPIFPDFIECPECGREVYRVINEKSPCPICGGKIKNTMDILLD